MVATESAYPQNQTSGDEMVGRAFREALNDYVRKVDFGIPNAEFRKTTDAEWTLVSLLSKSLLTMLLMFQMFQIVT